MKSIVYLPYDSAGPFLGIYPTEEHIFIRGLVQMFLAVLFLLLLFSHSVISYPLGPHGLQHARLPYPSLSHRVCTNSCPLSRWCHQTISSSVTPFSSKRPKLESIQMFINRRIDSNIEQITNMCHNRDESQKHIRGEGQTPKNIYCSILFIWGSITGKTSPWSRNQSDCSDQGRGCR